VEIGAYLAVERDSERCFRVQDLIDRQSIDDRGSGGHCRLLGLPMVSITEAELSALVHTYAGFGSLGLSRDNIPINSSPKNNRSIDIPNPTPSHTPNTNNEYR